MAQPLDVAGTLADGRKVNGPVALREAILSRPDAFVTVVTEKMLTYALGRGLEPGDMPVVRADREEGRAERLPAVLDCHGNCRKRTVSRCARSWNRLKRPKGRRHAKVADKQCTIKKKGVAHVHHQEAPFAPHVRARRSGRHGRAAIPGRHGAGALRRAEVAVPLRRGLLPVRRVSRHVAS